MHVTPRRYASFDMSMSYATFTLFDLYGVSISNSESNRQSFSARDGFHVSTKLPIKPLPRVKSSSQSYSEKAYREETSKHSRVANVTYFEVSRTKKQHHRRI